MSRSTGGINCVLPQLQALRTSDHGCGPPKPGGPERSSWALTSRFLPDGTPPSRTSGLMPSWAVNLLSLHAHPRPPPLCGAMGLFWGLRPCPRSRPRQEEGVMNENTTSHSPASHRATCTALCVTRGASSDPRRQPSPNGPRQLGWQPAKMPRGVHALVQTPWLALCAGPSDSRPSMAERGGMPLLRGGQKTPASISSTLLTPLICSLCWKQTPCYQLPVERPAWQGTGGGLQPMASRELSPSVQQPTGSRVLPAPHEFENGSVIGLRMRPRPRLTLRLQPVTDPEAGAPS